MLVLDDPGGEPLDRALERSETVELLGVGARRGAVCGVRWFRHQLRSYLFSGSVPLRVLLSSRAPLRRWFRQCGSTVIDARRPVVMAQ